MTVLAAQDVSYAYGRQQVLDRVSVSIAPGEVTALVGPSGSGKTTLLWLLAGLIEPASGEVCMIDADGRRRSRDSRELGMVFQQPALWEHLTARQHLELVLKGRGLCRSERAGRIERILARMDLTDLARRRPWQMSGGQRQRLAIARALVIQPRWLLLDEPTAHLDAASRLQAGSLLEAALEQSQAGVLMSTHDGQDALRIADRAVVLTGGRVAQSGPIEEVYRRPADLAAALALGPACQLAGLAMAGRLHVAAGQSSPDGCLLEGIDAGLTGLQSLILRPEELDFEPDGRGALVVNRCDWLGGCYHVELDGAGQRVCVRSATPQPPGLRGILRRSAGRHGEHARVSG